MVLGQRAVPEAVLQGRALRALADSQQRDAPVEGAALCVVNVCSMHFLVPHTVSRHTGTNTRHSN